MPAVDMCGSQSADTIKMNFRSQAPQLVDLSGLGVCRDDKAEVNEAECS